MTDDSCFTFAMSFQELAHAQGHACTCGNPEFYNPRRHGQKCAFRLYYAEWVTMSKSVWENRLRAVYNPRDKIVVVE